jgi:hypothetical protein
MDHGLDSLDAAWTPGDSSNSSNSDHQVLLLQQVSLGVAGWLVL